MGILNREIMTSHVPEIMAITGLASFAGSLWANLPDTLKPVMALLGAVMIVVSIIAKVVDVYFKIFPRDENHSKKRKKH